MTEKELNMFGKFLFKYFYNKELTIPIKLNRRLKRVDGRLVYFNNKNIKPYIEVSQSLIGQSIYIVADVLMHELTHYYLYKKNKPFGDNDAEFKTLLFQNGISESETSISDNGEYKYGYNQYSVSCPCGFKTDLYLFEKVKDFHPILMCPNCKKRIQRSRNNGLKYIKYQPTVQIKKVVDAYFMYSQALANKPLIIKIG